jgi:molecular chaperone GrpE
VTDEGDKREREAAEASDLSATDTTAPTGEPRDADEDELTCLKREVQELRDKNLRLLAETQNQQKRAERDRREAVRYAESEFAKALLVILDDFERTQESARDARDAQSVADGVRIVYEHFLKVLEQHGIRPIEAQGVAFDPGLHEAMMQQPSDEHPAGTVLQEVRRGYAMHERVLRPARVIVSSGPASADGGD